jgi:hypothetical protein
MAKIIGYLIGTSFVLGLLLGPLVGFYFVSKDTFKALQYSGKTHGQVEECTSVRIASSSQTRYRRVPKVRLDSEKLVMGTVDEIPFFFVCDDQIGKRVEVVYDLKNPQEAKINTFLEMWFMPLLLFLVCVVWYPFVIKGLFKKIK